MKFVSIVSGTSTDGLSIATLDISGFNLDTAFKILSGTTIKFSRKMRDELLKVAEKSQVTAECLSRLNWQLGRFVSDSVMALDEEFDVISFSGHTVYHGPSLGHTAYGTLQLGEISVLVADSGKTAVSDFRITDMAYGGLGAPLIALSDYILFKTSGVLTVNIGGIANVTYLGEEGPIAFDVGPGNMLIDQAMNVLYGLQFDRNGKVAHEGVVSREVLDYMMKDQFLKLQPPKNSGREYFGRNYLLRIMNKFPSVRSENMIRTLTRFTAESIFDQVKRFIPHEPVKVVVGGGGTKNPVLMSDLTELFDGRVFTFSDFGINDEFREALGFAILANQTLHNAAGRITEVNTMSGPVLGKIVPGKNYPDLQSIL